MPHRPSWYLDADPRDPEWRKIKMRIWVRDDFHCQAETLGLPPCSEDDLDELTVHHIVERQYGGSHDATNLVTVCHNCHTLLHPHLARERALRPRSRDLPRREL